jgi:hypothetical protein
MEPQSASIAPSWSAQRYLSCYATQSVWLTRYFFDAAACLPEGTHNLKQLHVEVYVLLFLCVSTGLLLLDFGPGWVCMIITEYARSYHLPFSTDGLYSGLDSNLGTGSENGHAPARPKRRWSIFEPNRIAVNPMPAPSPRARIGRAGASRNDDFRR